MKTKLILKKRLKKLSVMFTISVVALFILYFFVKGTDTNIPNQIKIKEIILGVNNDKCTDE
ncbi:hypothetical protein [Wolbachia pipientis]|nr:hypothetical protein [Wolbachia pipientis]